MLANREWQVGDRLWLKTHRWGVVTGVIDEIIEGRYFIAINVKAHDQGSVHSGEKRSLVREGWRLVWRSNEKLNSLDSYSVQERGPGKATPVCRASKAHGVAQSIGHCLIEKHYYGRGCRRKKYKAWMLGK